MSWRQRLAALRQLPKQRWLLTGMSISLVLPFFGPAEGCPGSAPFPCEADPLVAAAAEIVEIWVARQGEPYAIEVESFVCPDHGRLDGELRVPVDSLLGEPQERRSHCGSHRYWRERQGKKAGDHLRQQLRDRFIVERDELEPQPRKPRQPDVEVTVACQPGAGAGELTCDLLAELFVLSTVGEKKRRAVESERRRIELTVPADPHAVPIAEPPSLGHLLGLLVSARMGPLQIFAGGFDLEDITYLFLLLLTALSVALARRGWLPQLDRLAAGTVALVAVFSVLALAADAYSGCESLIEALPQLRLRGWLDNYLRRAQLGALLFAPLALARFVLLLRQPAQRR